MKNLHEIFWGKKRVMEGWLGSWFFLTLFFLEGYLIALPLQKRCKMGRPRLKYINCKGWLRIRGNLITRISSRVDAPSHVNINTSKLVHPLPLYLHLHLLRSYFRKLPLTSPVWRLLILVCSSSKTKVKVYFLGFQEPISWLALIVILEGPLWMGYRLGDPSGVNSFSHR